MDISQLLLLSLGLLFFVYLVTPPDKTGVPVAKVPVYRNEDTGKLYAYQERGGYNNVRQDWWCEIRFVSEKDVVYVGDWFKRNVGYPPFKEDDLTPFVRVHPSEFQKMAHGVSLR